MFYRVEYIPDEQTMQAVVAELLPLVPCVRRDKALRYKHMHGQYCCLRTWQMLHQLLLTHHYLPADFPLAQLTYTEDANGKPWLTVTNPVHFSISHTKNALAVAVADSEVGIDIEALISVNRLRDEAFLNYTLSPQEQQRVQALLPPAPAVDSHPELAISARRLFTELWTQKEAVFKAMGTGISVQQLPTILELQHPYKLQSHSASDYICSIAVR